MQRPVYTDDVLPESLQRTLDGIAARAADRKAELITALSDEQPAKSKKVDQDYIACTWWEGCYYCQDDQKQWHRVKCFL